MNEMHRVEFKSSKTMRKIICSLSPKRYKHLTMQYLLLNDNFIENIIVIIYD